ncbi:hypothetical protein BD779DRAFT_1416361, partial [Infundibulicybe gibba]
MFVNNPYAQGGWKSPLNPRTSDGVFPVQPSVFGALPSPGPTAPPIVKFTFTSFAPDILNSVVYGSRSQRHFTITTGHGSTILRNAEGTHLAFIDWRPTSVEIGETVPYQAVARWMALSPNRSCRSMAVRGRRYTWIPNEGMIGLYLMGSNDLLARVTRSTDSVLLEITTEAIQAGLLEVAVVAT